MVSGAAPEAAEAVIPHGTAAPVACATGANARTASTATPQRRIRRETVAAGQDELYAKSDASTRDAARRASSSSGGRDANRDAAANTFGSNSTLPTVLRKTWGLPRTQCTARSMSSCSVSGSYHVPAV